MAKKRIDRNKIIKAFLSCAFEKSAGAVSLADIATLLNVNKASLYNHFSSRDEIYEETILLCEQYMKTVQFIPETNINFEEQTFAEIIEKIIKQYFRSYEIEPLFQMYTFIHSCKFFSKKAADVAINETQKIAYGIVDIIKQFSKTQKQKRTAKNKNIKQRSEFFACAISAELNNYITNKKEIIRRNPESGNGSLFELPTDDKTISQIIAKSILFWK